MSYVPTSDTAQVLSQFKRCDESDYHSMIFFFELNEHVIRQMEEDIQLEIIYAYNQALFHTGAYRKQLVTAREIAEYSLLNNIFYYKGENLLHLVLFQKVASLYHLHAIEEAKDAAEQLLKISPEEPLHISLYAKMLRCSYRPVLLNLRAVAVLLFIISGIIILFEILMIRSIYPHYTSAVVSARTLLFFSGILLLGASEVGAYLLAERNARRYARQLMHLRQKNETRSFK